MPKGLLTLVDGATRAVTMEGDNYVTDRMCARIASVPRRRRRLP